MHRIAIWLAALGVLCLASNISPSLAAEQTAPALAAQRVAGPGILVIAHRGDCRVAPENTLPAFASALKAGADLVELDYYHSADGVPVVCHDADLDRTTNATALWGGTKLKLSSKNLTELRQLDAGSWFGQRFAGTRIPTLAEALDTIQAGSMTLVERKDGDPATCIELLKQKKLLDRVVVQSFDWDYLAECRRLAPKLTMAALGDKKLDSARLDKIAKTGASVVAWENKNTDASTIAVIHARGWKAWVWTVDDPARIGQLVEAKIDGIITNRPSQTRAAVRAARPGQ
ncbi:MAG: glycerophosphodiester phosphodiesterase [Planctomycetia bacterium]|nr:glycerophosphodiester phosphodiesterase [Planctomycetia bacterium]